MSAIVTDQFRILNANNFVESVESDNNSYYVFIGLSNPATVLRCFSKGLANNFSASVGVIPS